VFINIVITSSPGCPRPAPPGPGRSPADAAPAAGFDAPAAVDYGRIDTWQAVSYVRVEHGAGQVPYVQKVSGPRTGRLRHVTGHDSSYDPAEQYDRMVEIFVAGLEAIAPGGGT
jgi:hypothetical protein